MSKSVVYIYNFKVLYNIIFEIKNFFNFDIFEFQSEQSILDEQKKRDSNSFIIITKDKFSSETINNKQVISIESLPLKLISLVETINSNLLMQQFNFQSNIIIKNYKIDLNSRQISNQNKKLKLTEREIQIVLFLKKQKKPININTLQKEVWGYVEDLETHTVETHIYRLRKKIKNNFDDQNFIKSDKKGYFI
ncbi:winged helix-turn-helix domain-containing protein [Candidatus Pelagibacter sp.]|nr:winged helix-turn-helix domain-containing protein [Candidatus Pelagibacter sp.]